MARNPLREYSRQDLDEAISRMEYLVAELKAVTERMDLHGADKLWVRNEKSRREAYRYFTSWTGAVTHSLRNFVQGTPVEPTSKDDIYDEERDAKPERAQK